MATGTNTCEPEIVISTSASPLLRGTNETAPDLGILFDILPRLKPIKVHHVLIVERTQTPRESIDNEIGAWP